MVTLGTPKSLSREMREGRMTGSSCVLQEDVPQQDQDVAMVATSSGPEPAGFEALAVPHLASLVSFARWLTRDHAAAEDLVQQTFLKALKGFKSFMPGTNFRAWIFRILRNTHLSSLTRLERRVTVALESEEDALLIEANSATPESLLIERFNSDNVWRAMEQLPAPYREIIVLCDVEDASYREIAEILSIPIGTVMSRLARARKAARTVLSGAVSVRA